MQHGLGAWLRCLPGTYQCACTVRVAVTVCEWLQVGARGRVPSVNCVMEGARGRGPFGSRDSCGGRGTNGARDALAGASEERDRGRRRAAAMHSGAGGWVGGGQHGRGGSGDSNGTAGGVEAGKEYVMLEQG